MRNLSAITLLIVSAGPCLAQNIWTEDFANGVLGNNISSPSTWTQSGTHTIWNYDTNGPSGQYSLNTAPLASTTASNGFMIFDADLANPGGTLNDKAGDLISPEIDLSGVGSYVTLEFQHHFRYCCADPTTPLRVGVSSNGGATWSLYDVKDGNTANIIPDNPIVRRLTLYAQYPYTANMKIKFAFGATGVSHYYWEVDDVRIFLTPDNNLEMESAYHHDYISDLNYTITPITQTLPMDLGANIRNFGATVQSSTQLKIDLNYNGNVVHNQGSAPASFGLGQQSMVWINTGYTPSNIGVYTANYRVENQPQVDDSPENNAITNTFEISDVRWAKDDGLHKGSRLGDFTNLAGNPTPFIIANRFFPTSAGDSAYSVSAAFDAGTTVGQQVKAVIYRYVGPSQVTDWTLVGSSNLVTLTSNHITSTTGTPRWVNIDLTTAVPMLQGVPYMVGIEHQNTGSARVYVVCNGSNKDGGLRVWRDYGGAGWYSTSTAENVPLIRLNLGEFLEANLHVSKILCPGTACDGTLRSYPYGGSGSYTYEWLDGLGNTIAGQTGFMLSDLCAGTYSVVVRDGAGLVDTATIELNTNGSLIQPSFTSDVQELVSAPTTVNFTNTTPNISEFKFFWNFGQGSGYNDDVVVPRTYANCSNYTVRLRAEDKITGCRVELIEPDYLTCVMGLTEQEYLPGFSIYPSPNNGEFTLTSALRQDESMTVIVYNMAGKSVYSNVFRGTNQNRIELRNQPSGIYAVQIAVGNWSGMKLIVVQ